MIKIGLSQVANHFDYEANRWTILRSLDRQAGAGAELVVFPECAVTGYNTGMRRVDHGGVRETVKAVCEAASLHHVSVALPTPWPGPDRQLFNSVLIIDDTGKIAHRFDKRGLQTGEDRFFAAGTPHAREFTVEGVRLGMLICIEASQEPWAYLNPEAGTRAILWPGFYGVTPGQTWGDCQEPDDLRLRRNLKAWDLPLLQITCASSPEAGFWPDKKFGGSLVLDQRGREIFQARVDGEDDVLVELGDSGVERVHSLLKTFVLPKAGSADSSR